MRRIFRLIGLVAVLSATTAPALADDPSVTPGDSDTIDVGHGNGGGSNPGSGDRSGGGRGGGRGGGGGQGPTEPPPPMILDPQLVLHDGALCVVAGRQPGDPNSALAVELEVRYLQLRSEHGSCADDKPTGGTGATPSPAATVAAWADQADLPAPALEIRPGHAIVGKTAYLEITGPTDGVWHFEANGWSIQIAASSSYTVDWGDGSVDGGVTSQGGPWPDGDVHHTYVTAGAVTISVTQHWTADWTATGHDRVLGGRIEGLLWTTGELPDFPVEEIQAVRSR